MGVKIEKFQITITINLIHTAQILCFIFIYISVTGLLLVAGHFFKEEIVILICYVPNFLEEFYSSFKQYLILQEVDKSIQELKLINSEITNAKLEIKRLKNEIKIFHESSGNLKDMMLPDTTEIESKLRERREAIAAQQREGVRLFWNIVGLSVIYEAVILWIFW